MNEERQAEVHAGEPVDAGEPVHGASLVVLSGTRRGRTFRLTESAYQIDPTSPRSLVAPAGATPAGDGGSAHAASLHRAGDSYEIVPRRGGDLWVNGERVSQRVLGPGDLVELDSGAVLRFRLYASPKSIYKTFAEIFSDCKDCAKRDPRSLLRKVPGLLGALARDLTTQTSRRFRLGVSGALLLLGAALVWQVLHTQSLEQRLAAEQARVAQLAELLRLAETRSLRKEDLGTLRSEVEQSVGRATQRLEALEARSAAARRIIAAYARSVVFVQGAFGFVDPQTARMLRYVAGPNGQPMRLPGGQPMVGLDVDGPEVEIQFSGTAFVAESDGNALLLTNRHVARPWEDDEAVRAMLALGVEPIMRRMIGYRAGERGSIALSLVQVSEQFDLAVLRAGEGARLDPPFRLAQALPSPGDEVLVLGYPTGIRALLARAGERFVRSLAQRPDMDFWRLAAELSNAGFIQPLATRGIVGQAGAEAVVYDADTTQGGSGGPVLNLDGEVVAVNAAVLPDFAGSNMGVPAAHARALLEEATAAR